MTDAEEARIYATDTYVSLEFQGFVADTPIYTKENKVLEFVAKTPLRPPLRFKATGEMAKAFRLLLHRGCLIQATAVPTSYLEDIGDGRKGIVIVWNAKRLRVLGNRKVNIDGYADKRILDSLMPTEEEITEVGYVEPIVFGKLQRKLARAEEEKRRREEAEND